MNGKKVGRWVLFVGSVLLGLLAGYAGYWIFEAKVPAAMQTKMLSAEALAYYLSAGGVLGVVIFAWAMLCVEVAARSTAAKVRRDVAGADPR